MDEQADHEHMANPDEVSGAVPDVPPDDAMPSEAAPSPAARSAPSRIALGLCLLVLAILQGIGSFGAWFTFPSQGQSLAEKGIVNWRGFGWMTLVLAIVIVVVIVTDLVEPSVAQKAVTAALFGSSGIIAVYYAMQVVAFPEAGQSPTSVGWGLGLCMGVGVVGLGLGTFSAMLARPSHLAAD